jgi:AcrR family transcriptional regulator
MRLAAARREKYKADLMADMLKASREIFVQDGYEGFTIRKLANCIGCSPGNIYLYFKDKNAIFDQLVDESFALLLAALPQPDQSKREDSVALLRRGLRTYVDFGLDHPDHYRFSFLMQPAIQPRPQRQRAAYESLLRKVRLCAEEGRLRTDDVDCMAQALWAAAHGVTSLLVQRPKFPWVKRNKLIDRVLDSAVESLLR